MPLVACAEALPFQPTLLRTTMVRTPFDPDQQAQQENSRLPCRMCTDSNFKIYNKIPFFFEEPIRTNSPASVTGSIAQRRELMIVSSPQQKVSTAGSVSTTPVRQTMLGKHLHSRFLHAHGNSQSDIASDLEASRNMRWNEHSGLKDELVGLTFQHDSALGRI